MTRKYSVDEIERMRSAIRHCYPNGSHDPIAREADVEDRLRTYMMNGTDPEDLEAKVRSYVPTGGMGLALTGGESIRRSKLIW